MNAADAGAGSVNVFNLHRQLGDANINIGLLSAQKSDAEQRAGDAEAALHGTTQLLRDAEQALLLQRQHTELLQLALAEEDERNDVASLRGTELHAAMHREARLVAEAARLEALAAEATRRASDWEGRLVFTRESAQREVDRLAMECSKVFILYKARGSHVEAADAEVGAMRRRVSELEARCEAETQARHRAEDNARAAEADAQRAREAAMVSEAGAQMARRGESAKEEELVACSVLIEALESSSHGGAGMQVVHLEELDALRSQYEGRLGGLKADLNAERERCGRVVSELRELEAKKLPPPAEPRAEAPTVAATRPHGQRGSRRRGRSDAAKLDVEKRLLRLRQALGDIALPQPGGAMMPPVAAVAGA